ncbi:MAG: endonuclease/exonuclease/phosphatase family protein [Planctomycetes bacterium]|nr:endonuclease/exonuclease/phosphatase family protein [Planctomycetota bacterium]MCC7173039.1 endonuclease/exonuclease/phosphatase family protein [Planctomycetota bacterium]
MKLRVLTHNVFITANARPAAWREHARALLAVVREHDVAIACLQEVPRRLAALVARECSTHVAVVRTGPWPEEALVALLRRDRVRGHRDVAMPVAAHDGQLALLDLALRGTPVPLRLMHAHLDFYSRERRLRAADAIVSAIGSAPRHALLACGDFNEPAAADAIHGRLHAAGLRDAWDTPAGGAAGPRTRPGTFHGFKGLDGPSVHIDWVLANDPLRAVSCDVVDHARLAFSDHVAVLAEFELGDRGTRSTP